MLDKKSITELRGICQSIGVKYGWDDPRNVLVQKIQLHQNTVLPKPELPRYTPPADQRLRSFPPAKVSDEAKLKEYLSQFIAMGMHFKVDGEYWHMQYDRREDSGTMRMPPAHVVRCAERLMA